MAYPYLGDLLTAITGVAMYLPIPTFGALVALAILLAARFAAYSTAQQVSAGVLPATVPTRDGPKPLPAQMLDLACVAGVAGIAGAKLFHLLEYPRLFMEAPLSMIFSAGGFSIYGGLIMGGLAGWWYVRRWQVPVLPLLNALSPALALGYAIGRVGCQLSGDGDWGVAADMALKPNVLPDWLWAQTYENNIAGGVISAPGVYPTPLYEAAVSFAIFVALWRMLSSKAQSYTFFSYLVLSGFARLLVEKIRINSEYHLLGLHFTQAELISAAIILAGLAGAVMLLKHRWLARLGIGVFVLGALAGCSFLPG